MLIEKMDVSKVKTITHNKSQEKTVYQYRSEIKISTPKVPKTNYYTTMIIRF